MMTGIIDKLISTECIKIGDFQLKSGERSKYYFDMKKIISFPELTKEIGDILYNKLPDFDIVCGIPCGGLPIATYISVTYNKPMIFIRDDDKKYGTQNRIEGCYSFTDRCVLIDDVLTSGGSLKSALSYLHDKLNVVNCSVIFDRQQSNLDVVSVLNKTDIVKYRLNKIKKEKKSNVCFSADIVDINKLTQILNDVGPFIVVCKVHCDIFSDFEKVKTILIELSVKYDFLIMEDRKFNDISYIVSMQYKRFYNWVDLVTCHSIVTDDVIKTLSGIMLVTDMSNNTYNFMESANELITNNKNRLVGLITQKEMHTDLIRMTPGISLDNSYNISDQKYRSKNNVNTDFYIIGRNIYNSENPCETIKKFLK